MNVEEILQYVSEDKRALARQEITHSPLQDAPALMKIMMAVVAVLAAFFAGVSIRAFWPHLSLLPMGMGFALAGWIMSYAGGKRLSIVLCQFGQVFALAGQGLCLTEAVFSRWNLVWFGIGLAAVSYPVFKTFLNRFVCCSTAVVLCLAECRWDPALLQAAAVGLCMIAGILFVHRREQFYPLASALLMWGVCMPVFMGKTTFSLPFDQMPIGEVWGHWAGWTPLLGAVLSVGTAYYFYLRNKGFSLKTGGFAVLLACAAAVLPLSCVMGGLCVAIGYMLRMRVLTYAGILWGMEGLVYFYGTHNSIALGTQAWLLLVSGLLLLAVRKIYAK